MGKVINLWVALLVGMFIFCQTIMGQNNPYKIDDSLYTYHERCLRMIKNPTVMLMADTLFQMAARKGDVKAQCLAKNLKSEHYYYTGNITALLTEKEKVADFARKTPFTQYVFGAWNRIITYYLRQREYADAFRELKKYQEEALRLNDPYGIGQSYIRMGDAYFQQRMFSLATDQYMAAVDYYQSIGKENELYQAYYSLGSCYTSLAQYKKAEQYTLQALDIAPNLAAKIGIYLGLFRVYINTRNEEKATEIKKILDHYRTKGLLHEGRLANYYIYVVSYYIIRDEYDKALSYSDSIPDLQSKMRQKSYIYAQAKDYKNAYLYEWRYSTLLDSLTQATNSEMLASYNARFNNQKLELEKNRLSLQNTQMKLAQLEDRERIMLMEKERARIELENKNLQLEQQRTATELEKAETQKQRLEVLHKQEELQRIEMEKVANKRKGLVIISLLLLITAFSVIYAITHRLHAKHLQIEKDAAEKARLEAEKADRLKSAFLQNMSHEIRTPLNAIVGFNDLLNDDNMDLGPEERQELLAHLHTNTDLLLTLVNDVLDLSKLESGNYNITLSPVNLDEVCQGAMAGVAHRVQEGVELLLQKPDTPIIMTTDKQRLQQILTNLLINACKYTTEGSITVAYQMKGNKVSLSVTDTGCGIPKDKAEVIFQRFEKLDSFRSGFGLGLSICRSLTQVLGGEIYLDTEYTGGAGFIVEFPLQHLQQSRA